MKLEEVLPALREGKKIRRFVEVLEYDGFSNFFTYLNIKGKSDLLVIDDILADDWEIEDEKCD